VKPAKIFTTEQIRRLDAYTITNEPISSIDLMERVSISFVKWFTAHFDCENPVSIFAGLGNNGGDGLAIARLLANEKYKVEVFIIRYSENCTDDFVENYNRLPQSVITQDIRELGDINSIGNRLADEKRIIIDALLGTGISRRPEGLLEGVIQFINNNNLKIVSVDIPSGLYPDKTSVDSIAVNADFTIAFQIPKLAFLMAENSKRVGYWSCVDIGLSTQFITEEQTSYFFLDKSFIKSIYKKREKFSHKGDCGKALLIAGSFGKMGAAVLAAKGCLRAGIGLLTIQVPGCGVEILQSSVPEAMVITGKSKPSIDISNWKDLNPDAIGIGPGIGKGKKSLRVLTKIIQEFKKPIVIDADAINLIAEYPELLDFIAPNSILTPHVKEFERLVGNSKDDFHRLEKLLHFSKKQNVFTILKGRHTAISTPSGEIYFNSTGNPGMATGGSGDVLTGIITSLLAQGYSSFEASVLGVYIHGLSGDIAAKKISEESLIASDLTFFLGKAFLSIS
jgi:ADP-dependent NAD(P)H-hydrate dehydratase / NAD(P)H-hydrate epimerase